MEIKGVRRRAQKEYPGMNKVCRVSIDFHEAYGKKRRIPSSTVLALVEACGEVYDDLEWSKVIETFRITFSDFGRSDAPGPTITTHLKSAMGNTMSHGTDFRFMGDGGPEPTKDAIVEHLAESLPRIISSFLDESRAKLAEAEEQLAETS